MLKFPHEVTVKVTKSVAVDLAEWCKHNLPMLHVIPSERTWDYLKLSSPGHCPVVYGFRFQDEHLATLFALTWGD
jgi:hypothetical protein